MAKITAEISLEEKEIKDKSQSMLLWISMASMVMIFIALTSAVIVRKADGNWLDFALPFKFYISTAVILLSSATMLWATNSAKLNNFENIKKGLLATLALGIIFIYLQFSAWSDLVDAGIFFAGPSSNASGSFMYVLTWAHLMHLIGGIIGLLITYYKATKQKYDAVNMGGLKLCSTYWHFLDILWVYLLLFLLFIR